MPIKLALKYPVSSGQSYLHDTVMNVQCTGSVSFNIFSAFENVDRFLLQIGKNVAQKGKNFIFNLVSFQALCSHINIWDKPNGWFWKFSQLTLS